MLTKFAGFVLVAFAAAGCRSTTDRIVPSPLSLDEQRQRILEIVPAGTPREAAVETLKEAGISGSFGVTRSIYYCDLWDRGNGNRWHLNVALLFDEDGRLYRTRPGELPLGYSPGDGETQSAAADSPTTTGGTPRRSGSAEMAGGEAGQSGPSGRDGRRTPFAEQGPNAR